MSEFPPPEDDGAMVAHDNVGSKRHRRPSVRLGDIGGYDSSFDQHQRRPKSLMKSPSNKVSKNHHLTNLSSNQTLTLVDTNPNGNSNFMKNSIIGLMLRGRVTGMQIWIMLPLIVGKLGI